jgi:hypothetical protein
MIAMRFLRYAAALLALVLVAGAPAGNNGVPLLLNNTQMNQTSIQAAGGGFVERAGFAAVGDGPVLKYTGSATPCVLGHGSGDGAIQIPAKDGCWNRAPQAVDDVSSWGFSNTAAQNYYFLTTGNDYSGKNHCLVEADPCQTPANGLLHLANTINKGVNVYFYFLDTGPYTIGLVNGRLLGALTNFPNNSGTSWPYLEFVGTAASPTVVNQASASCCAIFVSSSAVVVVSNMTFSVTQPNGIGLFVQNHGYLNATSNITYPGPVTVTSAIAGVLGWQAIHVEGYAYFEWQTSLVLDGSWSQWVLGGQNIGYFEEDPNGTITCGPSLSWPSPPSTGIPGDGGAFLGLISSAAGIGVNPGPGFTNCPHTGVGVQAWGHSLLTRIPGAPGDEWPGASYQIGSPDVFPQPMQYQPSVSACANGALVAGANTVPPSNYAGRVSFSGAASTCTITFGKPAAATSYFTTPPACSAYGTVPVSSPSLASTTAFTVAGSFVSGSSFDFICSPRNGG